MALVHLADIIEPESFSAYLSENSLTSTALFQSGVLVPNSIMATEISNGGNTVNVPFWGDLLSPADPGGSDPNLSSDNPASLSTPNKISAHNQVVRRTLEELNAVRPWFFREEVLFSSSPPCVTDIFDDALVLEYDRPPLIKTLRVTIEEALAPVATTERHL